MFITFSFKQRSRIAISVRKVMEEAQKLESNYGIENMIVEISNILRDSAKKKMYT
jgi:hypothetical protein